MPSHTAEEKRFRAESDMRTLVDAALIRRDKVRHEEAMKLVHEQRKALSDIDKKTT